MGAMIAIPSADDCGPLHVSVATLYRHVGKRGTGDGGPDASAHG
jgi:hypothetical protein